MVDFKYIRWDRSSGSEDDALSLVEPFFAIRANVDFDAYHFDSSFLSLVFCFHPFVLMAQTNQFVTGNPCTALRLIVGASVDCVEITASDLASMLLTS